MNTDAKVAAYLVAINVAYSATYVGLTDALGTPRMDSWTCKLGKESFKFHTGLGNREKPKPRMVEELKRKYGRYVTNSEEWRDASKPVEPTAASLLYCLLLDSRAADISFDDWCADYGYDTDSRKALETYIACQGGAHQLRRVFKQEQLAYLESLLEDY